MQIELLFGFLQHNFIWLAN